MKRSTDRIITTHVGSLPRPHDLLDLLSDKINGRPYDEAAFEARIKQAIDEVVKIQADAGIEVVSDGEMSKAGFFSYVRDRLTGFEPGDPEPFEAAMGRPRELAAFPDYYKRFFGRRGPKRVGSAAPVICRGPVRYVGHELLHRDIAHLKDAMARYSVLEGFMPAIAPRGVGRNEYYVSETDYVEAVANAMHEEYAAIVEAGLVVQVDDAWLTNLYSREIDDDVDKLRREARMYVELLNHALRGIPTDMIRFHTCYGINEGPRVYDVPFKEFIDIMLEVDAGAYSFEFGNPRHAHEWHLWEQFKLPEGKNVIPGFISHTTNVVEHPELIADQICNFASLVGREAVIAGADCGFSSNASYDTDVEVHVVWAKFQALAEGARIATQRLWK